MTINPIVYFYVGVVKYRFCWFVIVLCPASMEFMSRLIIMRMEEVHRGARLLF